MNPIAKLAGFAVALALVFVTGLGIGRAVGPLDGGSPPEMHHGEVGR